jgi:hypothetical protein
MLQTAATPEFFLQDVQFIAVSLQFKAQKTDDHAHHMHM